MSFIPTVTTTKLVRIFPSVVAIVAAISTVGCGLELPSLQPATLERFDLSSVPPIDFPQRPAGKSIAKDVDQYIVSLPVAAGQPGHASDVRVLLPSNHSNGPAADKKIPALIFNGPGAFLFSGMSLTDGDIDPMIRYAQAGFAVIGYATDGCQPDFDREPSKQELEAMVRAYVASKAGLINATRALDYALEKFPEIDPDQIYAIGQSSGGKQALLLAQHDDRIRGTVAFAPACRMDMGSSVAVSRIASQDALFLLEEVNRSMPIVHAKHTKTPTMLVYSQRDRVVRAAEVLAMAEAIGEDVDVIEVDCDSHGQVPNAGFQDSLEWLSAQVDPTGSRIDLAAAESTTAPTPLASSVSPALPTAISTATPIQPNSISGQRPSEAERKKLQQEMLLRAGIQSNPFLSGN
jgi:dienelactone hydrolase